MELSEANRIKAIRELPSVIKDIYASDEIAAIIERVKQARGLEFETGVAVRVVGDCILGFYKTTALSGQFQNQLMIGADDAQRLTSELLELLSPVIAKEEEGGNIKREELQKLADTFAEAKKNQPAAPAEETAEPQAVGQPEDIQPLRTMQSDMNRVHGYGAYRDLHPDTETTVASSQANTLNPTAPPPPATQPTPPQPQATPAPQPAADGSVSVPIQTRTEPPTNPPPAPPQTT